MNHGVDAGFVGNLDAIGKGEECIGSHHRSLEREVETSGLGNRLLEGIDARGLADTAGKELLALGQDNRIALGVLDNLVGEEQILNLRGVDRLVGHGRQILGGLCLEVAGLNQGAVET